MEYFISTWAQNVFRFLLIPHATHITPPITSNVMAAWGQVKRESEWVGWLIRRRICFSARKCRKLSCCCCNGHSTIQIEFHHVMFDENQSSWALFPCEESQMGLPGPKRCVNVMIYLHKNVFALPLLFHSSKLPLCSPHPLITHFPPLSRI